MFTSAGILLRSSAPCGLRLPLGMDLSDRFLSMSSCMLPDSCMLVWQRTLLLANSGACGLDKPWDIQLGPGVSWNNSPSESARLNAWMDLSTGRLDRKMFVFPVIKLAVGDVTSPAS
eukprot:scaffold69948_cov38-Prasinocladus_malaysianus.AAC.1